MFTILALFFLAANAPTLALKPPAGIAGFSLIAPASTGLLFTNVLPEQRHLTNLILLNGSGVAAGDVDGDGRCDLYFCRLDGPNALYRNLGDWKFEDVTAAAGVALPELQSTGCALVDLDGDGDLDLVVNSLGQGTRILYNDGKGHFTISPTLWNQGHGGMTVAAGDLNQDGYPDLYIANYRTQGLMDIPNARATFKRVAGGQTVIETFDGLPATHPSVTNRFVIGPRGSLDEQGQPDLILFSDKGTNFTPIPFTSGHFLDESGQPLQHDLFDWGLSAMIRDLNGDGLPDIYVCNDFQTPDRMWINQGGGNFRLAPALTQRHTSLFSMAVDFADVNRDGFDDFFVVDMLSRSHAQRMRDLGDKTPPVYTIGSFEDQPQYSRNTLFLNRGDNTFAEIGALAGVEASDWSWSCIFLDVDLDGWEDLLISNGMERAARDLDVAEKLKQMRAARRMTDTEIFQARRMFPRLANANAAFQNRRDGTFQDRAVDWGFATEGVSTGMALADLDNDGDLDVIINNLNAPAGLYRNNASSPRVAVHLHGIPPNTHGIGARITLHAEGAPVQSQQIIAGGRYLSSDESMRTFAALGSNATLEVRWPSGRVSSLPAQPISLVEVDEAQAGPAPKPLTKIDRPLFEDASALVNYVHPEIAFDDQARQPLLEKKLSQLGPGIVWIDLDGDGWQDLVVGSGKEGRPGVFLNRQGRFEAAAQTPVPRDALGLAAFHAGGKAQVLEALSNYEDGLRSGAAVRNLVSNQDTIPADESSPAAIALADVDGDGDLDLFVGGRVIAANYPLAPKSRFFRNEGGAFVLDSANTAVLSTAGLVSGATFSDLDGDGDSDLALACEWSPIRIFLNDGGKFRDATEAMGLARYSGWWNSIAAGDFDGDGRMDLVAGNWGRNTPWENYRSKPLRCYYGDFDNDGTFEVIESHWDEILGKYVPEKQLGALPLAFLRTRFRSNQRYSTAGIEEVLGPQLRTAQRVEANWLESSVFLNRGDHFEVKPLPLEAQFAPVFGVALADFDGDGFQDLVLAENFFAVQPDVPRYDGGRGLLLLGDGKGNFRATPGRESGIIVWGEQRGAAAADFDNDGRPDVAVAQNGAALKLFRNQRGTPGLRVKLAGTAQNPDAIGARLRLVGEGFSSPLYELHSGEGYLSQNSLLTILPARAGEIQVTWPGGSRSATRVEAGAREITIHQLASGR